MKHAWRNLIRIPWRTIIMLIVLFTVFLLLLWSVLTSALCATTIRRELGDLEGAVRITDGGSHAPTGAVPYSLTTLEYIADNFDLITDLTAYVQSTCDVAGISPLRGSEDDDRALALGHHPYPLSLCSESDILPAIIDGSITITAGTGIARENDLALQCKLLISDTLAEQNDLALGDSLLLQFYPDGTGFPPIEQSFVIGGIYTVRERAAEARYAYQRPENGLILPLSTYCAATDHTVRPTAAYFRLAHANEATVHKLEARLYEVGYREATLIRYTPENVTAGISRLLGLVRLAALLLCGCGVIAFLTMIFLNLQSRTRELGVLTALGQPRRRTVNSFFLELLLIALAAFLPALIVFFLSAEAGSAMIGAFLRSESLADVHVATTSAILDPSSDAAEIELLPHLLRAVGASVGVAALTLLAAYRLIRRYLAGLDVLRILGGGAE